MNTVRISLGLFHASQRAAGFSIFEVTYKMYGIPRSLLGFHVTQASTGPKFLLSFLFIHLIGGKKLSPRHRNLIVASIIVGALVSLVVLAAGCQSWPMLGGGGSSGPSPSGLTKFFSASKEVVTSSKWSFNLASLGVMASIFAIGMGAGKLGWAALVACIGSSVYSMIMLKYAWLIGILGLVAGILITIQGWRKNKEDKHNLAAGFIKGFQWVKDNTAFNVNGFSRAQANELMGRNLTPEAKDLVAKVKGEMNDRRTSKHIRENTTGTQLPNNKR